MSGTLLLSMDLGDVEHLRVLAGTSLLALEAEMDGCGSTTLLNRDEARRLRDVLTAWLADLPAPSDAARVIDCEGDTWRRDGDVWRCETPPDGERVLHAAWLRWDYLARTYGPLRPAERAS